MARPLRIQYAGARYHLMSRGDRREPIFSDDKGSATISRYARTTLPQDWLAGARLLFDE